MSRKQREPIRRITLPSGAVRWRLVVDAPPGPDGRRKQTTSTHRTQREARVALADHRVQMARGTYVARSGRTLEQAIDEWLASRRLNVRAVTLEGYAAVLRRPRRVLGQRPLSALKRADVAGLLAEMADAGLSPRTCNLTRGLLQQVLEAEVRDGRLHRNVAAHVDRVAQPHREMDAWSPGEAQAFIAATTDHRLTGGWALTMCGLRRSEVLGMTWRDLDLDGAVAVVRRGRVAMSSGSAVESEPKSTRSRRTVPLPAFAVAALRRSRALQAAEQLRAGPAYRDSGYVVCDELGVPLRPEVYSDAFQRVCREAGLRAIRLHDTRHSAASLLLARGVPIVVVAAILGHDPAVTASTYGHAFADDKVAAMKALDGLIGE